MAFIGYRSTIELGGLYGVYGACMGVREGLCFCNKPSNLLEIG